MSEVDVDQKIEALRDLVRRGREIMGSGYAVPENEEDRMEWFEIGGDEEIDRLMGHIRVRLGVFRS